MNDLFQLIADSLYGNADTMQSLTGTAKTLLITVILSSCMMIIYRFCQDALTYRRKFNVTLMMLALSSNLLLAVIQNNPMFSLGALGALSICRIRINTRDPRDLGFVFWALMIGVSSAMEAFLAGFAGTLVLSAVMIILRKTEKSQKYTAVVVRGEKSSLVPVQELFHKTRGSRLQSQNLRPDSFELVYELRDRKQEDQDLLMVLGNIEGVKDVNLLAPDTQVV